MSSSIGKIVKLTLFGESHGPSVGMVLDGIFPGEIVDLKYLEKRLTERKPGGSDLPTTTRKESDKPIILSGLRHIKDHFYKTINSPIAVMFENEDADRSAYDKFKNVFRPGHADYTSYVKSGGHADLSGGGHFSGRMTAPLVYAGTIAEMVLLSRGIKVDAEISEIGGVAAGSGTKGIIKTAAETKNSVGGKISVSADGVPAGLGAPFFDTIEGDIAKMLFAIPGVKGVQFGLGFEFAKKIGAETIDAFYLDVDSADGLIRTDNNFNGGVNGGISNGMPITLDVAIKPTASIGIPMKTLNFGTGEEEILEIGGRHDPCIAVRAVPVVRAAVALVLLDFLAQYEGL